MRIEAGAVGGLVGVAGAEREQVLGLDRAALRGEDDAALDDVLQLAHIARPAVAAQRLQRAFAEALQPLAVQRGEAREQRLRQQLDVGAALAQRYGMRIR